MVSDDKSTTFQIQTYGSSDESDDDMTATYAAISESLIDAQEMSRRNPDTFGAPAVTELEVLAPGYLVKVCNGNERFWTEVKHMDGEKIYATVGNDTEQFPHGLCVQFEKRHAYTFTTKDDMRKQAIMLQLQAGLIPTPTKSQQKARCVFRAMKKHGLFDIFDTGKATLAEQAMTPLDLDAVVAWFVADPKKRLKGTGLKASDVAVIHVKSIAEGFPPEIYDAAPNLVLAHKDIAFVFEGCH